MQVTEGIVDFGKAGKATVIISTPDMDEAALARRAAAVKQVCREIADRGGFDLSKLRDIPQRPE